MFMPYVAYESSGDVQKHVKVVFVREIDSQCMFTANSVFDSGSIRSLALNPMYKASV